MLKKSLLVGLLVLGAQNVIANNDLAMLEAAERTADNSERAANTLESLSPFIKAAAAVIVIRFGLDLVKMAIPAASDAADKAAEALTSAKAAVARRPFVDTI